MLLDGGTLRGSFFSRTVVFVCSHDEDGAFGLVLNRPTETQLQAAFDRTLPSSLRQRPLFSGGPVQPAAAGSLAMVNVGSASVTSYEAAGLTKEDGKAKADAFGAELKTALTTAGYPAKADGARINIAGTIFMLWLLVLYVTMVYGPIAAYLVELFPTRIRYTSMSLPYHIGNGWFGGFLPAISFALVAGTGNLYYGLWYPIIIALMSVVIGGLFLRETKNVDITK